MQENYLIKRWNFSFWIGETVERTTMGDGLHFFSVLIPLWLCGPDNNGEEKQVKRDWVKFKLRRWPGKFMNLLLYTNLFNVIFLNFKGFIFNVKVSNIVYLFKIVMKNW